MADEVPEEQAGPAEIKLADNEMYVKVFSRYEVFYDGAAQSLSAENDAGPFDVLPKHYNFLTLVNAGEVVVRSDGQEDKKIRITRGVLHIRNGKATMFLDV